MSEYANSIRMCQVTMDKEGKEPCRWESTNTYEDVHFCRTLHRCMHCTDGVVRPLRNGHGPTSRCVACWQASHERGAATRRKKKEEQAAALLKCAEKECVQWASGGGKYCAKHATRPPPSSSSCSSSDPSSSSSEDDVPAPAPASAKPSLDDPYFYAKAHALAAARVKEQAALWKDAIAEHVMNTAGAASFSATLSWGALRHGHPPPNEFVLRALERALGEDGQRFELEDEEDGGAATFTLTWEDPMKCDYAGCDAPRWRSGDGKDFCREHECKRCTSRIVKDEQTRLCAQCQGAKRKRIRHTTVPDAEVEMDSEEDEAHTSKKTKTQ